MGTKQRVSPSAWVVQPDGSVNLDAMPAGTGPIPSAEPGVMLDRYEVELAAPKGPDCMVVVIYSPFEPTAELVGFLLARRLQKFDSGAVVVKPRPRVAA